MKKLIRILYIILFTYILLVVFFSNNKTYLSFREPFIIKNIIIGLIIIIPILVLRKTSKKITDKNYKKILIISSIIAFVIQLVILRCTYFYTDWDVKTIRDIITNNDLIHNYYLTKYPNTLVYLAILKFYYSIPILGKYYFPLLIINALLVNISSIIASLTIKRFTNNFNALLGYYILFFLTVLSPWINIPYSDTFTVILPIPIIYLYTKKEKNNKDLFFIGFLSILGYYLKPTVFIVFIAISIIYIIDLLLKKTKVNLKVLSIIFLGIITSFFTCKIAVKLTGFKPYPYTNSFGIIHYLAMGQNNDYYGLFNETDVYESDKYGRSYDIKKTLSRIKERNIKDHLNFLEVKTLLNFNDGTFAWGLEGEKFYYKVLAPKDKLSKTFQDYFYLNHKNNYIFKIIMQTIWLFILILSLFAGIIKDNNKYCIIYLSLIGLILFLTLFECRARYLYCYSPVFVTAAMIGLENLKKIKKGK